MKTREAVRDEPPDMLTLAAPDSRAHRDIVEALAFDGHSAIAIGKYKAARKRPLARL
ncbi:hypothetical protein [Methylosinus sp. Ce-a6]|uniref:hypothetical protein n=1 Tax=Methylosinus sp. Ce-a6 TaxID=2172005 RepID=UPI0013582ED0|nr:hypothetical protein [Methylosinus sp. Ce-a6]